MKRLNVQLEDKTVQQLKLVAVREKKSVSAIMREATMAYLATKKEMKKKAKQHYADDIAVDAAMTDSFKTLGRLYQKLAD